MKKKIVSLFMAVALCAGSLSLGACSKDKSDQADGTVKGSESNQADETVKGSGPDQTDGTVKGSGSGEEESEEVITIRLLTRLTGTRETVPAYVVWADVIDEFKEKHPGVNVVDESQGDEASFDSIMSTDLASGTMANIFAVNGVTKLGEYIDNGVILNLEPYLKEDLSWSDGFMEGPINYYRVPGYEGVYAVPNQAGLIGFFYNKDLFQKAGIDKFPETWTEFLDAIEKLKASGVVPIAIGPQSTYMVGHIHNEIFYRWMGCDAAKQLGSREIKWTDPDVIKTLQFEKDLIDAGAFDKDAVGMTADIAGAQFQEGKAAMILSGPWNNSHFSDKEECSVAEYVDFAKFPYFEEKPEFKDNDMQTTAPLMVSGKLTGKELELTIELLKMFTNQQTAKRFAEEGQILVPRKDVDIDKSKCTDLFNTSLELSTSSEKIGGDVFEFDPLASMADKTRNSIFTLFTGASPETVAEEIQKEVDNNLK